MGTAAFIMRRKFAMFRSQPTSRSVEMPEQSPSAAITPTILVVEDDPVTQSCLQQWLARWGLHVHASTTLGEALAWLSARPDCAAMLLDQHLPDAAEHEITARMKAQAWIALQRVVAMTAAPNANNDPALKAAGYAAILAKPVTTQNLATALAACALPMPVWRRDTAVSDAVVDPEILLQLRSLLKRDLRRQLESVESALAHADTTAARSVLHTLSGAAALCAAVELDLAITTLSTCLSGDSSDSVQRDTAIRQLQEAVGRVLEN